jgi:hypothetical protein
MILRTLILAALALLGAALPAQADIAWDMRTTPRQLGPTEHIRVGTLSGPWALVMQYLGRPPVCSAGWYLEHRTAAAAPYGWSEPVVGVDGGGVCAAVRDALPPPVIPDPDPADLVSALQQLSTRIAAELAARIQAVAGTDTDREWQLSRAIQIQAAVQAGTATETERAELAALLQRAAQLDALRRYAHTPATPPLWGPAPPAAETLYGWAEATLIEAAAVVALDPAQPPTAAPQWPTP